MTRRNVRKQGWVFSLFYIEVVIQEVWALDITVYQKCPMALNNVVMNGILS